VTHAVGTEHSLQQQDRTNLEDLASFWKALEAGRWGQGDSTEQQNEKNSHHLRERANAGVSHAFNAREEGRKTKGKRTYKHIR